MLVAIAALMTGPQIASAQDPSISQGSIGQSRAFRNSPSDMMGVAPKINSAKPLLLQGDELIYDSRGSKVVARGNVEILYNNFVLKADKVTYDQAAGTLTAEGNVLLTDPNGNITRTEFLKTTDDFRDAFAESLSIQTKDESRIVARRVIRRDGNVSEFEDGKFTPCKSDPGKPPLWCISAARIIHDQNAATITYQDAKFEFFGIPVLALPYFQMADPSVKRRSGFLAPQIGSSTTLGFTFELPYYFALSNTYDFTFSPEYLSKQGMLYKGEYRQRLENGNFNVKFGAIDQTADGLSNSSLSATDRDRLTGWRGTLETHGVFSLGSWWKTGWNVTIDSDDTFRRFYGFDSILQTDRVNNAFLTGISERNYFGANLYQLGGLQIATSDQTNTRAGVIDSNYIVGQPILGGELNFSNHARTLSRLTGEGARALNYNGADSTHLVTELSWRRKLIDGLGQTWTPYFSGRGDFYQFNDARTFPGTGPVLQSQVGDPYGGSLFRGTATAALTYGYPLVANTGTASHVLEPKVQIVSRTTNNIDQRKLPNEDSRSIILDDQLLFDLSKTSGFDRIDEGTRLNVGTEYTFQSTTTGWHARLVAGQSFLVAGQNIFSDPGRDVTYVAPSTTTATTQLLPGYNFSPNSGLETARSDYVFGMYLSPLKNLSLVTQARFDAGDWTLRRQDTLLSYYYGPLSTQLLYTQSFVDPKTRLLLTDAGGNPIIPIGTEASSQRDILASVGLKLTDNWSVLGQVRYDIDANFRLQDMVQVKYSDECFVLSATFTESFINDPTRDIKPDRTVMLRFDLKYLGGFGTQTSVSTLFNKGENQPSTP